MGQSNMSNKRNANMDLLRMLSMMMVTMLHALGKSGLLMSVSEEVVFNGWLAWLMEAFSICAVNIFMILSGYFLIDSEYKTGRLLELVFQTFFYTAGTVSVYFLAGRISEAQTDIYQMLRYCLPIHMDVYWFITAYIAFYLLLPVLQKGVRNISREELGKVILLLLVFECLIKSVLPVKLAEDARGYSLLWYLILFLIGAYFKLYGFRFIKKAGQGWMIYVGASILAFAEVICLYYVSDRTGRLKEMIHVSMDYNHVFPLLAAIGIFGAFRMEKQIPHTIGSIISKLSPYALGVYLFQESDVLRYEWQKWFGLQGALSDSTLLFLCRVIGAVLAMYALGTVIDYVRSLIFRLIVNLLSKGKKKAPLQEE